MAPRSAPALVFLSPSASISLSLRPGQVPALRRTPRTSRGAAEMPGFFLGGGKRRVASAVGRLAHNGWHDKILPSSPGRFPRPYLLFGLFGLRLILIKATLFRQQSARERERVREERERGNEGERGGIKRRGGGTNTDGNIKKEKSGKRT